MPGSTSLTSRAISTKSTACWPRTELGWQLPIRRGKSYGVGSYDWCRTARILSRTQERPRGVSVCRSACAVWIQAWRTPCGATTAVYAGWIGNTAAGETQPWIWRTCAGTRRSTNSALRSTPGCATATAGPRETMALSRGSGCGPALGHTLGFPGLALALEQASRAGLRASHATCDGRGDPASAPDPLHRTCRARRHRGGAGPWLRIGSSELPPKARLESPAPAAHTPPRADVVLRRPG